MWNTISRQMSSFSRQCPRKHGSALACHSNTNVSNSPPSSKLSWVTSSQHHPDEGTSRAAQQLSPVLGTHQANASSFCVLTADPGKHLRTRHREKRKLISRETLARPGVSTGRGWQLPTGSACAFRALLGAAAPCAEPTSLSSLDFPPGC